MHPMIYEQKMLKLAGLKKEFSKMQPEAALALWETFLARLPDIKDSVGDYCYGVITPHKSSTEYFCGIEVSTLAHIPEGLQAFTVPPSTSAKFKHVGPVSTVGRTVHSVYSKWLPLCDWKHADGPDLEIYPLDYNPKSDNSVMEYSIPLKG